MFMHYEPLFDIKLKHHTGTVCPECASMNTLKRYKNLCYCNNCNSVTPLSHVLMNEINDFKILYPDKKITVRNIKNFSGDFFSDYQLRKKLNELFCGFGIKKGKYYA